MIMFWNRKEVYIGYLDGKFYKVLDILKRNKIKYDYKIFDNGNEARFGSFGENQAFKRQCYMYVAVKDFETAQFLLRDV